MLLTTCLLSAQAAGTVLHGLAEVSAEAAKAEGYYQSSLRVYPASPATHFGYGMWLYNNRRWAESGTPLTLCRREWVQQLNLLCLPRWSGRNPPGTLASAERTLATAVRVYPASVFLLVRHAAALARNGRGAESKEVFSRALLLDPRAARGWQQLIDNDIDAAYLAAKQDPNIAHAWRALSRGCGIPSAAGE